MGELTRHLAMLGVIQTLLFADGDPQIPGVAEVRLRVPPIPSNILRDLVFGARVGLFAASGFDVIHTHGDAPVARGGSIAALRMHAVHVHTFHGDLVARGLRSEVLRRLLPKGSWYLAVSHDIAQSLARAGANRQRTFVRTSGVREEFFGPSRSIREPDVAIGGRLIPEKRIGEFVREWAAVDTDHVRLRVFGSGPESREIEEIARRSSNVEWLGQLDAAGLSDLLTSVAAGLVTGRTPMVTKSNEGTPTLALEMLAAGCFPLVGPWTGEAPRLIRELRFGKVRDGLPAPREVADLALHWASGSADQHRSLARLRARKLLSWNSVAAQIKDFYERLVDTARP